MDDLPASDLKTIIHSRRANLYYLEHCRILVNGGRVEYVTEQGKQQLYWNIPIANTTAILLGTGTSITQAAVRELGKAGVLIGFSGGGGTPLFSATERDTDILWFSPQSEYRPTEYLQHWVRFWFDDDKRLAAARTLQHNRLQQIRRHWLHRRMQDRNFHPDPSRLDHLLQRAEQQIEQASSVNDLLTTEARLTRQLFKLAVDTTDYGEFTRAKRGTGTDPANRFLDHGNYLAYGLGAVACWVLGLPHGLAVLHGKTRRGGLVFDAADLVKDALILPQAFVSAVEGHAENTFRQQCIELFAQTEALDCIIGQLQEIAATQGTTP